MMIPATQLLTLEMPVNEPSNKGGGAAAIRSESLTVCCCVSTATH